MTGRKKPNAIDMMTFLIDRKDQAREKRERAEAKGNLASALCWQAVECDAQGLLAYISGDELWNIKAAQSGNDLNRKAKELDIMSGGGEQKELPQAQSFFDAATGEWTVMPRALA